MQSSEGREPGSDAGLRVRRARRRNVFGHRLNFGRAIPGKLKSPVLAMIILRLGTVIIDGVKFQSSITQKYSLCVVVSRCNRSLG